MEFIRWAGLGVKKVYAFEPDPSNALKCEATFAKLNDTDIQLVKKGLWSKEIVLKFRCVGTVGTRADEEGESRVETCAIDEIVPEDEQVTFIKMDIEGAELEALYGAKNTIVRCRPRLAICVYHKPEDIVDITSYVHELLPDFDLYIRHYISCRFDTILYAVPHRGISEK